MSSFEILEVKNFLKTRFITTSSEWVEACIDFIKQEQIDAISSSSLKECVYNQWLSADLEEIGVSSLPRDLLTIQKTTLNGPFALQANFIRDVGKPAYAQFQDLNKRTNSNEEFSAAPLPTVPAWEAKPTRMLMLNLTDGCTTVQGMEYRPINTLSLSLPPGVKVLIQGPVDCRFGVILLTPEKIKVLGGEVESKLEQFSQQALLRQMLNLPAPEESLTENNNLDVNNAVQPSTEIEDVSLPPENTDIIQQHSVSSFRQNDGNPRNVSTRGSAVSRKTSNRRNNGTTNTLRNYFSSPNQVVGVNQDGIDDLNAFDDEDDDFVQSLNYEAIDELEKEISSTQSQSVAGVPETDNIWQEDEDVLQDLMNFQEESPVFEMPFEIPDENPMESTSLQPDSLRKSPFTYLSAALNQNLSDCIVTIKGFIIKVLSKLECTIDKGWNLCVKINDGTATLDANIHDKVLEGIIGVSAVEMVKLQKQAAQDQEKRKEIAMAISKCKSTLQDYNCLMDLQLSSDSKPCIMKCYPVTQLQMKQLMERVRSQLQ
ncbi:recQ-mediated genome instability protein 1 isoform X2 [Parasteatoda tepidariorum]|uniref:recQ-mediated genome instability protein 1 isoform X2 n=1 Tax=Parasteatoda tepidariorum TaxID=114398 RepID=UPI001C718BE5|nr:recQ-mediated genome instability protein 1 isoform X2 [Parasteatoda tepidariorum]